MKFDREINARIQLINTPSNTNYRGEIIIRDLKMSFSVFKSLSWATNKGELKIWNIGRDKRNQLGSIGDLVSINAGYRNDGGAQLLFTGNTTEIISTFPTPEIVTSFILADGDKTLNNVKITVSFDENTPVRAVIEHIAEKLGVPIVSTLPQIDQVYSQGFFQTDLAKNLMDKATKFAGLWWGVQNGNLVFQRANVPNEKVPREINVYTGMIGTPEPWNDKRNRLYVNTNKQGWTVRTLLTPDILPGDRVKIKSSKINLDATCFVETIQHDGDNYSDNFISTLQVINHE
ncbi:MAG: hypothetical protein QXI16_01000 [Sulfolobaceae archaeon]